MTAMRRGLPLLVATLLVATLGLVTVAPSGAATRTVIVAGYSNDRTDDGWGLYDECMTTFRSYLADGASFGAGGTVDADITLGTPVDVASPASLAGVDIFVTGWTRTDTYTPEELAALRAFVEDGGALLATVDGTSHDMSSIFDMVLANGPGTTTGTFTDPGHPVADGPFGSATEFAQFGDVGHWTATGDATVIGTNSSGAAFAVIPAGALGAGSGPVVLTTDIDIFSDYGDTECNIDPRGAVINEAVTKNAVAWLIAGLPPEPAPDPTTTTSTPATTAPAAPTTMAPTAATATAPAAAVATAPRFTG